MQTKRINKEKNIKFYIGLLKLLFAYNINFVFTKERYKLYKIFLNRLILEHILIDLIN